MMERIIVGQTAALTFSVQQADRMEALTFKDHNQDQGAIQISGLHREAQIHRNRMVELRGIPVPAIPPEVQMFVNPPAMVRASKDLPADHP